MVNSLLGCCLVYIWLACHSSPVRISWAVVGSVVWTVAVRAVRTVLVAWNSGGNVARTVDWAVAWAVHVAWSVAWVWVVATRAVADGGRGQTKSQNDKDDDGGLRLR